MHAHAGYSTTNSQSAPANSNQPFIPLLLTSNLVDRPGETLPITGYEVWARKGNEIKRFSTLGTGLNEFGSGCSYLAAQSAIKRGEFQMGGPLYDPADWDERELTVYQGEKFLVLDRDGYPLRWSKEPPSFFHPPVTPLRLAMERNNHGLEVVLSGDGASSAVLEESDDLLNWGVAYSLSSPPRLSSDGIRRHSVNVDRARFYRILFAGP